MKELYETGTEMSKGVLKLKSDHYTIVAFYLLTVCIFLLFPQVSRYKANPKTKTIKYMQWRKQYK